MRTSRPRSPAPTRASLLADLSEAAEQYGRVGGQRQLKAVERATKLALTAGVSERRVDEVAWAAFERGQAQAKAPPEPVAKVTSIAPPPPPEEKRRMISSPDYPTQPCGQSYKDFRLGQTYKESYHEIAFGRGHEEGVYHSTGRSAVLRRQAKAKRAAYDRYLADCAAQEQYEIEQAHGGREGEYAEESGEESGEFDMSFDPSMFQVDDESLMFNPRCPSCGGASHPASGSVLPSGEVVCGPCVRRFWSWASEHGKKTYRVGKKGKGSKYIAFPTGITQKNPRTRRPREQQPDWGPAFSPIPPEFRATPAEIAAFYGSQEARDMGEVPRRTGWSDDDDDMT